MIHVVLFALVSLATTFPSTNTIRIGNMVAIVDNYFVDPTEVTNIAYRSFLYDLLEAEEQSTFYPDTSVWGDYFPYRTAEVNPLEQVYFRHPAYDNYPVVGVKHTDAQAFCEWRQRLWERSTPGRRLNQTHQVHFRLPSEVEWELIARLNQDYPKESVHSLHYLEPIGDEMTIGPAPVTAYGDGTLGLYHLWGNVAEMVQESGIAKGGYWEQTYAQARSQELRYEQPEYWLGFRCVCVIEAR